MSVAAGVPDNAPEVALKVAQFGLFVILNDNVFLSASAAVGAKLYVEPTVTAVGAYPLIVGGVLAGTDEAGAASTVIVNGVSVTDPYQSVTRMVTFGYVPTSPLVGLPQSLPLV